MVRMPEGFAMGGGGTAVYASTSAEKFFEQSCTIATALTWGEFFTIAGIVIGAGGLLVSIVRLYVDWRKPE